MILYIENPKDTTRKLIELVNKYSKVSGYKINIEKSLVFLYMFFWESLFVLLQVRSHL